MARPRPTDEMTCSDAARAVGVSAQYIAKLAREGVIPSRVGFGGRRIVRLAAVQKWAAQPVDPAKGGRARGSGAG